MPTYNLLKEKMKGEKPKNTFIIPFLYSDWIEDCIDSIWEYCDPKEHRIIVIDNQCDCDSSCKPTNDMYHKLKNKVHLYIHSYRNLGCAKSWNIGIQMSDTTNVTIMGDDTRLVDKDWWTKAEKYLESYEAVACGQAGKNFLSAVPEQFIRNKYTDKEWWKIRQLK